MYNKHTNSKTEYSIIIDNRIGLSFNTEKKRKEIIRRLKGTRNITCTSNFSYPWNPEEGIHGLVSPSDFAERIGIKDVTRITKAIKNGKIETEMLGDDAYIVEKYNHYYINGIPVKIERKPIEDEAKLEQKKEKPGINENNLEVALNTYIELLFTLAGNTITFDNITKHKDGEYEDLLKKIAREEITTKILINKLIDDSVDVGIKIPGTYIFFDTFESVELAEAAADRLYEEIIAYNVGVPIIEI